MAGRVLEVKNKNLLLLYTGTLLFLEEFYEPKELYIGIKRVKS